MPAAGRRCRSRLSLSEYASAGGDTRKADRTADSRPYNGWSTAHSLDLTRSQPRRHGRDGRAAEIDFEEMIRVGYPGGEEHGREIAADQRVSRACLVGVTKIPPVFVGVRERNEILVLLQLQLHGCVNLRGLAF